jgi:dipeptidyl aminopeptidase/acylaminoacyl peptidase
VSTHHLPSSDVFADLAAFTALPRLTGLALSADGMRLVATVQQPDDDRSRYVSSLWQIPLDDGEPLRLTRSEKGETAPAFLPDGGLLFVSARPDPDADEDEPALWLLPPSGEPYPLVRRAGGVSGPVVARDSGAVVFEGARLTGSTDDNDAERRKTRTDRKITAILHTGMPIRYWDHELGDEAPRLLLLEPGATAASDLAADATLELIEGVRSISADGLTVVTTWRPRRSHGRRVFGFAAIDVASGKRSILMPPDDHEYAGPVLSPDGGRVAVAVEREGAFETPVAEQLSVLSLGDGEPVTVSLADLTPTEWVWSADSATLFVAGDLHGRGAIVAVDPTTGEVQSTLAADAVYSSLCPAPDGAALYALRSAWDSAPTPARLDPRAVSQTPRALPTPAPTPDLPGRLVELDVPVGEVSVHAWLCLPAESDTPAPVMQWIHGGPFGSYNAWSWRWNPWVAVARGWAVIMPDPALSTGYGQACIDRAWPYLADVVWHEVEGVLDSVLLRPDVDASRVALLGASFGGFMTNWIAGHADRFQAIVTHAGLWALDQQHATTDAAHYKAGIFGTVAEHPDWYAAYSPHNFVDRIRTPMLISHGNRDYRVPVSEAMRLWWDLVSRWDGPPEALPHRFLQLTSENHWVLSPSNAEVWYDAVLGFCAEHVLGESWTPSHLL